MKIIVLFILAFALSACHSVSTDAGTKSKEDPSRAQETVEKPASAEELKKTVQLIELIRTDKTLEAKALLAEAPFIKADRVINQSAKDDESFEYGITALEMTILKENLEIFELLLQRRPDLARTDSDGNTCLHKAAFNGSTDIVGLLLQNQADPNARNHDGDTPIQSACYRGGENHADTIKILLAHHANPNLKDKKGNAPLHIAAMMGGPRVVETLLDAGVKINEPGPEGFTPLILAAWADEVDSLKLLLRKGADPDLRDDKGKTALDWAIDQESKRSEKILRLP